MRELELGLAVSARPWADRLHRHTLDHGGARVRVRVIGTRDALDQEYDVLFIDDTCSFLDRRLVQDLARQGRGVVAVVDADHHADAREWVERLGVADTVSGTATPEEFIECATAVGRSGPRPSVPPGDLAPSAPGPSGRLLAVMGCSGGVGATEIAIAIAGAWPGEAILVDLDTVSPSIAQRLGLRLLPNVRSALGARRATVTQLEGELHVLPEGFRVLPGLASASDWRDLSAGDLVDLLADLRRFGDTIVNLPAGVPARSGPHERSPLAATRQMLEEADTVVAVSVATPVGVSRLFEWAAVARSCGVERPAVLFNTAPRSAFARAEIEREVGRVINPISVDFLPGDDRVRRAGWDGRTVKGGPFVRATARATQQWVGG